MQGYAWCLRSGKEKREEKPPREVLLKLKGAYKSPGELAEMQILILKVQDGA